MTSLPGRILSFWIILDCSCVRLTITPYRAPSTHTLKDMHFFSYAWIYTAKQSNQKYQTYNRITPARCWTNKVIETHSIPTSNTNISLKLFQFTCHPVWPSPLSFKRTNEEEKNAIIFIHMYPHTVSQMHNSITRQYFNHTKLYHLPYTIS